VKQHAISLHTLKKWGVFSSRKVQVAVYQILWCTKWVTWSNHARRRCMRMKFREICLQIDDVCSVSIRNVCYHSEWSRWPSTTSCYAQNGPSGATALTDGLYALVKPTCPYVVGQCSIPYSVCGRGSSRCFNLYIMGSGKWPPKPVWVIADVPHTCTLSIIDLQVNVTIIQVFTASVSVVAPGAPLRAS